MIYVLILILEIYKVIKTNGNDEEDIGGLKQDNSVKNENSQKINEVVRVGASKPLDKKLAASVRLE